MEVKKVKLPGYAKLRKAPSEEYRVSNLPAKRHDATSVQSSFKFQSDTTKSRSTNQKLTFNNVKKMFGHSEQILQEKIEAKQELPDTLAEVKMMRYIGTREH